MSSGRAVEAFFFSALTNLFSRRTFSWHHPDVLPLNRQCFPTARTTAWPPPAPILTALLNFDQAPRIWFF